MQTRSFFKLLSVKTFISIGVGSLFIFTYFFLPKHYFLPKSAVYASDMVSYLTGAEIVKNGGGLHLYNLDFQYLTQLKITGTEYEGKIMLPFLYLPINAYIYIPFTFQTLLEAYNTLIFWIVILCALYFYLLKRVVLVSKNVFWLLLALIMYLPHVSSLFAPQLIVLISILFVLIYENLNTKKYFLVGFFTALLLFKPTFLLSAPFLFLYSKDKKAFIKGFAIPFISMMLINISISGPFFIDDYLHLIKITDVATFGNRPEYMFGIYHLLKGFFNGNFTLVTYTMAFILVFSILVFKKFIVTRNSESVFTFILFVVSFLSPHMLLHDMAPLFICFVFFLRNKKELGIKDLIVLSIFFISPAFSISGLAFLTSLCYLLVFGYFMKTDLGKSKLFSKV